MQRRATAQRSCSGVGLGSRISALACIDGASRPRHRTPASSHPAGPCQAPPCATALRCAGLLCCANSSRWHTCAGRMQRCFLQKGTVALDPAPSDVVCPAGRLIAVGCGRRRRRRRRRAAGSTGTSGRRYQRRWPATRRRCRARSCSATVGRPLAASAACLDLCSATSAGWLSCKLGTSSSWAAG